MDLAYFITLETAEKVILDVLAVAHEEIADSLTKEGIRGAWDLRTEWGENPVGSSL
jgi:NADH/NAD ratio-sensing transcriptional regulator Rex